jgi:hypothetical protein
MAITAMCKRLVYLEDQMSSRVFHALKKEVEDDPSIEDVDISPKCMTITVRLTDQAIEAAAPMAGVINFLNTNSISFSLGLENDLKAA